MWLKTTQSKGKKCQPLYPGQCTTKSSVSDLSDIQLIQVPLKQDLLYLTQHEKWILDFIVVVTTYYLMLCCSISPHSGWTVMTSPRSCRGLEAKMARRYLGVWMCNQCVLHLVLATLLHREYILVHRKMGVIWSNNHKRKPKEDIVYHYFLYLFIFS